MKITGLIYAISAAITWGLVYAIDGKVLAKTTPISLLFINSALTFIVTLPILFFDGDGIRSLFMSGRTNIMLVILSLVLATLANYFIFSGIKILGPSTASIIEISYPFFVVIFSAILYGGKFTWQFALGAILIFAGAAIITRLN